MTFSTLADAFAAKTEDDFPKSPSYTHAMIALPNALTILRILLVPVFAVAFVMPGTGARFLAFAIFVVAGVSDWLDGFAARKLNAGSEFGRMLDPIADKVLVAVALMMLVAEGDIRQFNLTTGLHSLLLLVPALIILSREILVSGLREFLAGTRVSVPVTTIAKFKTAVQMLAIGAMILTPIAYVVAPVLAAETYEAIAYVLLWVAAALTLYTGVIYFKNGLTHIRPGHTPVQVDS
jgi:cardiolipin synthase (CMP-forming)